MSNVLEFLKLSANAVLPRYQTTGAAGADLHSSIDIEIPSGEWRAVSTGLAVAVPSGFEMQIRPRSGLAFKYGLTVLNAPGTVDSDYRGEILVLLINHGPETFQISAGDRIAQMVITKATQVSIAEVDKLSETERGTGGFGSTGRN